VAHGTYLKYSRSQVKEPIINIKVPDIPFYKVSVDIAEYQQKYYLVLSDYYSRWLEIIKLKGKTGHEIVENLKVIFSKFGIPKILVADNNPFNSSEFKTFSKERDFNIVTCSPHYHQSNRLSEKAVDICKNMLRKSIEEGVDLNLYLLNYRNSPTSGLSYSLAQLLQCRRLRSLVNNFNEKCLKPAVVNACEEIIKNKDRQRKNYNKSAGKEEEEFNSGEKILIQNKFTKKWLPGYIIKKTEYPRSYWVKNEEGKVLRRNTIFIKKAKKLDFDIDEKTSSKGDDIDIKDESIGLKNEKDNSSESTNVNGENEANKGIIMTRYGRISKRPKRFGD